MTLTKGEWRDMKFPYTDDIGFVWVDHDGFLTDYEGPCFMCKNLTKRVDVNYEGYYCGSDSCEEAIRQDLERYNDQSE